MKALRKLLTPRVQSSGELADIYLKNISIKSSGELNLNYQSGMNSSLRKCEHASEFLSELIKKMEGARDESTILKMLTIIHYFFIYNEYSRQEMKGIQEINVNNFRFCGDGELWFCEFLRSYLTYFVKIYSQANIYQIALSGQYEVPHEYHLSHLFMLTNTISTLFPYVLNGFNTVGRYHIQRYGEMRELFIVLSGELCKIYDYMKYLVSQIFRGYRSYDVNDLKCFIGYLSDLEILCDRIEDIVVNKYIKGSKVGSKIEFRQEFVVEIRYYLDCLDQDNVHNETVESLS